MTAGPNIASEQVKVPSFFQRYTVGRFHGCQPLRFCALAGGTDSSLVLPRDSAQARSRLQMQQHADWTEPPRASWVGVEWREVQIQSLEPWRYASKESI